MPKTKPEPDSSLFRRPFSEKGRMKTATLCFAIDHNNGKPRVLLGLKKRSFGKGKWNGFGGKIEANETPEQAIVREMREESGLTIQETDLQKRGEIFFKTDKNPFKTNALDEWMVHVFVTEKWGGKPVETDEMKPEWFLLNQLPFHQMWADDSIWLLPVLEGSKIKARFEFGVDDETIKDYEVEQLG